jgi:hypothetical protein
MTIFFIIGTITGILLEFRFKVLALIPATFLITVVIAVDGLASGQRFGIVSLTMLWTVALVQIGYISGYGSFGPTDRDRRPQPRSCVWSRARLNRPA